MKVISQKQNVRALLGLLMAGALMMTGARTSARTPQPDIMFRMRGYLPSRVEDWEAASSVDIQARFWANNSLGTAFSIGFGTWTAMSEYVEEEDEYGYLASSIYGNMTTIPVGISALFRSRVTREVAVVLEAGFRYVLATSNIRSEMAYDDGVESGYIGGIINTDDALLAVVGVNVQTTVGPGVSVECGLGYQFDLLEPRESFLGEDVGSTSLRAVSVNLGCSWQF